jgi:hypothetical protein
MKALLRVFVRRIVVTRVKVRVDVDKQREFCILVCVLAALQTRFCLLTVDSKALETSKNTEK